LRVSATSLIEMQRVSVGSTLADSNGNYCLPAPYPRVCPVRLGVAGLTPAGMGLNAGDPSGSYQGLVCTLFEKGPRVMCGTERLLELDNEDS
jgi:hypothetical protein